MKMTYKARRYRKHSNAKFARQMLLPFRIVYWIINQVLVRIPREAPSPDAERLFYDSKKWFEISRRFKDIQKRKYGYLWCRCCGAESYDAMCVTDHVKSVREHWHLRWSMSNFQILCNSCNRRKGSRSTADFRRLGGPAPFRLFPRKQPYKQFSQRKWKT